MLLPSVTEIIEGKGKKWVAWICDSPLFPIFPFLACTFSFDFGKRRRNLELKREVLKWLLMEEGYLWGFSPFFVFFRVISYSNGVWLPLMEAEH